jgi:hypothetical protein
MQSVNIFSVDKPEGGLGVAAATCEGSPKGARGKERVDGRARQRLDIAANRRVALSVLNRGWGGFTSRRSSASVEECEDGEHSPVGVRSNGYPKLAEDVPDVLLDGTFGHPEPVCDRGVGASFCHQLNYLPLPRCEDFERVRPQRSADQVDDELGIENDPSFADSLEGIEQLVDVGDGVLEQVADTGRSRLEELDYLARFDVAREEQDSHAGKAVPDLDGRVDAFLRLCRRHVNIDDRNIRRVSFHRL